MFICLVMMPHVLHMFGLLNSLTSKFLFLGPKYAVLSDLWWQSHFYGKRSVIVVISAMSNLCRLCLWFADPQKVSRTFMKEVGQLKYSPNHTSEVTCLQVSWNWPNPNFTFSSLDIWFELLWDTILPRTTIRIFLASFAVKLSRNLRFMFCCDYTLIPIYLLSLSIGSTSLDDSV